MKTVKINLGPRTYEVRIGRDLLCMRDELIPWIDGKQVCVVTDDVVAPLYLETLCDTLADKQIVKHIIPHGEANKTLASVEHILECMLSASCERETTVIALGGGVVGDMAGFAAACYQRGVPFIQIPTTLLAQVDSSVGGKTGVNHALGKNMIGAFHQPRRVLADIATLDTLDARQFAAGLAEVIKYGIINDPEFFEWLETNIDTAMKRDPEALEFIIERSCIDKANIVEQDELESGARALLNLGHTFGHAIEAGSNYGEWLHGEAIATGMAMAAHMSAQIGWLSAQEAERITALLTTAELPIAPFAGVSPTKMLELMQGDKKVRDGNLRLVLLKGIGKAEITSDYPAPALTQTLEHFAA